MAPTQTLTNEDFRDITEDEMDQLLDAMYANGHAELRGDFWERANKLRRRL